MEKQVIWHSKGQGFDVVLIHGWSMNGAVWASLVEALSLHYCVHWCDLPGYGDNRECRVSDLEQMRAQLLVGAPDHAVWLGWSLGGLLATDVALNAPERVDALITVSSSPKFVADAQWLGIQPDVLNQFQRHLIEDFSLTIERFMAMQAMGSPTARQDIKAVKKSVLSRPTPDFSALVRDLEWLCTLDFRARLSEIDVPFLRLYGRLDALVPYKMVDMLNKQLTQSVSHIFPHASHAPFISHPDEFNDVLLTWLHEICCGLKASGDVLVK